MISLKMTGFNVTSLTNHNINQRGTYMIHAVIPMECYKYPSILIPKHANVLDEVINLHNVNLFNTTPDNKCKVLESTCKKSPFRKLVTN